MDLTILSVDQIGLSTRSSNALHRSDIHLVGDMIKQTEESLSNIRNLGQKSIDEILEKIQEIKMKELENAAALRYDDDNSGQVDQPLTHAMIRTYLDQNGMTTESLEFLSPRSYNILKLAGYDRLSQFVFLQEKELLDIDRMDPCAASEIQSQCSCYLTQLEPEIRAAYAGSSKPLSSRFSLFDLIHEPEYRDDLRQYVLLNDMDLDQLSLSTRPKKCLLEQGLTHLRDIIFLSRTQLQSIPKMGAGSIDEIQNVIKAYLNEHESRLRAYLGGDSTALLSDQSIRSRILRLFQGIGFAGLSFSDFKEQLHLPAQISDDRLKQIIGGMLAEHQLEYCDFRCYWIYQTFSDCLEQDTEIDDRSRDCILRRLNGETLEDVAQVYGLTRERVRQIVKKNAVQLRSRHVAATGTSWFDEDYYQYLYATYTFEKKDAIQWFGLSPHIFRYMEMMGIRQGTRPLSAALEDRQLDAGLRLKIKNYLNRNRVYVDGIWVEKSRSQLERLAVRHLCADTISYQDFPALFNHFLEELEIPYNEKLYYTDAVLDSRRNHLEEARFVLWCQNGLLRYYDIDGREYDELLDTLNLESFQQVELSTQKLFNEHPELMRRYDIRDHYELHNLLRKVVPEGSYHNFHCGRTPNIKFGEPDRDQAIWELLQEHAPISAVELAALIQREYGYDTDLIMWTYLRPFENYCHNGIYRVDHKVMSPEHQATLLRALDQDFYYLDEIRSTYLRLFPDADTEEINSFNLKSMGFIVLSRYALQHYPSLDAYFQALLTTEDIVDLAPIKKRFATVTAFSQKMMELKRSLDMIEFEPNQAINFRKLEASGVTKEMIGDFCDEVYDFVEEGACFSPKSLRLSGFQSELYELGFSDFFYGNLLLSDPRFTFTMMYGVLMLCKSSHPITIKSFLLTLIGQTGNMDILDLIHTLNDTYGCNVFDRSEITYKLQDSNVYYDKILDRLYITSDAYYHELDEMEGI